MSSRLLAANTTVCEICGDVLEDQPPRCEAHAHTETSDEEYFTQGGPFPQPSEKLLTKAQKLVEDLIGSYEYDSEVYEASDSEKYTLERLYKLKRHLAELRNEL